MSWDNYNLPAIQAMLAAENTCVGADAVLEWDGLASAVDEQLRRLEKARDELAAVWPPDKSDSAAKFQEELGKLARSMKATMQSATNARVGLNGVMDAINEARMSIDNLARGRSEVADDWTPRFVDQAEDEFDRQAQQVMRDAEATIAGHSRQFQSPPLYDPGIRRGGSGPEIDVPQPHLQGDGGSSGGGSGFAPIRATPIPVPVPHTPVLLEPGHSGGDGGSITTPGSGPGSVHFPAGQDTGSKLATTTPSLTSSTLPHTPLGPPVGPGSGNSGFGGVGGGALPIGLTPPGSSRYASGGGIGGFGGPAGGGSTGGRQAVPMRRGLPSGAVIGEGSLGGGRGQGLPGQVPGGVAVGRGPMTGGVAGSRTPVSGGAAGGRGLTPSGGSGGVGQVPGSATGGRGQILRGGGGGRGQMPGVAAAGPGQMMGGSAGRRGGRADGSDHEMGGEADEQWETLEGVAPVIAPDTTPVRHDPGPGVLGFNR